MLRNLGCLKVWQLRDLQGQKGQALKNTKTQKSVQDNSLIDMFEDMTNAPVLSQTNPFQFFSCYIDQSSY